MRRGIPHGTVCSRRCDLPRICTRVRATSAHMVPRPAPRGIACRVLPKPHERTRCVARRVVQPARQRLRHVMLCRRIAGGGAPHPCSCSSRCARTCAALHWLPCHHPRSTRAAPSQESARPVAMWQRSAQSRCRCGRGEPSAGAEVGGVSRVPGADWGGAEASPAADAAAMTSIRHGGGATWGVRAHARAVVPVSVVGVQVLEDVPRPRRVRRVVHSDRARVLLRIPASRAHATQLAAPRRAAQVYSHPHTGGENNTQREHGRQA